MVGSASGNRRGAAACSVHSTEKTNGGPGTQQRGREHKSRREEENKVRVQGWVTSPSSAAAMLALDEDFGREGFGNRGERKKLLAARDSRSIVGRQKKSRRDAG